MKGFEEWLRKSFLHVIFSDSGGRTRWVTFDGPRDRENLVYEFGYLWDHIFHVMRQFLIEIHYTNDIDLTGDTLRPHTEHEVYVNRKKLLIAPSGPEDCSATTPVDEYKLAWWEHRKLILQRSTGRREGVAWLLQDREEMDELARRYPDAKATLRRPFMMPAIQFRRVGLVQETTKKTATDAYTKGCGKYL
ncbi:unnamed protein product [Aureobasidium mustum]|uniref:Uncharacterized protein n=1 Tax=Aureobasidium mustum TaxID=2773714 RepID=A0A9N8PH09_9PEZI|nr:unnamed protein product [Aureobasidium mustum]